MKQGKHQRRKQRCQDLCSKVYDRTQSFVLPSYSMQELHNHNLSTWLVPRPVVNNYIVFCRFLCTVKAKKESKNIQKRTLPSSITVPLY